MAKLTGATPITVYPPTAGLNKKAPLLNMEQASSPWLLNVDCYPQSIKVRNGYVIHSTVGASDLDIYALGVWGVKGTGVKKLFAYCNDQSATHKIYDVSASAEALDDTLADNDATQAYPVNFARQLIFSTNTDFLDCNDKYNGSVWSDWTFTYSASPIGGQVVFGYKSRMYILVGASMYYGGIDAIAGATTLVDFTYILNDGADFAWGGVISNPGERDNEVYMAIGTISGEVLVYGGDYPDSATWGLVGRYKISEPLGYNSILQYRNDIWILTDTGIVSLRDLMLKGSIAAEDQTVSSNIDHYWTRLIAAVAYRYWSTPISVSAAFWPERNQIYVLVGAHIDKDDAISTSTATMCVYNTITQAWSFHKLSNVDTARMGGLTYYAGGMYFFTQNVVMKVDTTGYKDETWNSASTYAGYDFEAQGPYMSFGSEATTKKIVGIQPIMKTDFGGTKVGFRAVADVGRQSSGVAYVELIDGLNKPYYNVGAEGIFLQYRMEGTSDTTSADGLELFAVAMIIEPGGVR